MPQSRLVELRVLDGPNLYFPRPAIQLTLDIAPLLAWDEENARRAANNLEMRAVQPGSAGSQIRRRFVARLLARLTRRLAASGGVSRLGVRSRPVPGTNQLVVAFPWRRKGAATFLGERTAELADHLLDDDLDERIDSIDWDGVDPGDPPTVPEPGVPVIGVTGTNGKTTVTRLLAHIGSSAGLKTGWCSTTGVFYEGELVDEGDWSGFRGAGQVLSQPGIELAVLEIARGGMLLRGVGTAHLDVAVVTNVSEDHLGEYGIETLDHLAEVKGMIVRIVRAEGWAVLNGDDPRVLAMRGASPARPFVFSRDPTSPGIRTSLTEGGRAITVLDNRVVLLDRRGEPESLLPVREVPLTLAGLSSIHIENALAGAGAAIGVGISPEAVIEGLRTFRPDPRQNPGRLNLWSLGDRVVVVDYAHNQESLEGLLEVMGGLRPGKGETWVIIGTAGDRSDSLIKRLGEVAALGAEHVAICEKERYLRGRDRREMSALMQEGAARFGKHAEAYPTELDSLVAILDKSGPEDVVGLCCHAQLEEVNDWLRSEGASLIEHEELLARVWS